VWHTAPDVSNQRLSYPVTYWNTLGLLATVGIVLAFHLTCSLAERRFVRVLAAAVVPLLAATLFFTFSRGSMAVGAIGLAVYVSVARPRGLLSGALSVAPATAALIVVAYHANLLDTVDTTTPAAVSEGHAVALAAGICALVCAGSRLLLAVVLDARRPRFAHRPSISPRRVRGAGRARGEATSFWETRSAWDRSRACVAGRLAGWAPSHNSRLILALLCLATLALPVSIVGSQSRLGDAEHALYASDCATASPAALASIGWLDVRPEPYEIVGFCDLQRGLPRFGVKAMRQAVVAQAPEPVSPAKRTRPASVLCRPGGPGPLRNPWSCTIRYRSGTRAHYRVEVQPNGYYSGTGTGIIDGCCVKTPTLD
jgi:hypothetical protein